MSFRAGILVATALALGAPAIATAGSGATLQGAVQEHSPSGPVPSQDATVQAFLQPGESQQGSTVTPATGLYSFNVEPGDYEVVFTKLGFAQQCRRVTAPAGETTTAPTPILFPTANAAQAIGTVTDSVTSDPIPGATVEVNFPDSCEPPAPSTTTDANGNFSFASLPAGTYYFTFSFPGYNSQTVEDVFHFGPDFTEVIVSLAPVDATPPDVSIDKVRVKGHRAIVKFSGTDPEPSTPPVTFQCKLDKNPAEVCPEPKVVFKNLSKGRHRVTVIATDGNANSASVKKRFKIR
jgi:hypothetical protein